MKTDATTSDRVHLNIGAAGMGSVLFNGIDFSNEVNAIDVHSKVGELTQVTLHLSKPSVLAEAKARVVIDDKTAAVLLALGWTPPSPEQEPTHDKDSADAAR